MKTKKPSPAPINLVVPNTIPEKMAAIVNLSQAVLELSKAIASTNVHAHISNNTISAVHTGISISTR